MKLKTVISIAVTSVAVAAVIVAAVLMEKRGGENGPGVTGTSAAVKTGPEIFESLPIHTGLTALPMIPTAMTGIYYTDDPVEYFELKDGAMQKIEADGTVRVSFSLSGQKIAKDISYIRRGGKITGYAVYKNGDETAQYPYFFFELTNLPMTSKEDSCMLLGTTDPDAGVKLYEEAFTVNLKTGATKFYFEQMQRTVDPEAKQRDDFHYLTDGLISRAGDRMLMFSGRKYQYVDRDTDLFYYRIGMRYPLVLASRAHYMYAYDAAAGTVFLRKTESGFSSILLSGSKETVLREFDGDFKNDYASDGPWAIKKSSQDGSCLLYNINENKEYELKGVGMGPIDAIKLSPDGKKLILAGSPYGGGGQKLVFYDMDSGRSASITAPSLFSVYENYITWRDGDGFTFNRYIAGSKQYELCSASFSAMLAAFGA